MLTLGEAVHADYRRWRNLSRWIAAMKARPAFAPTHAAFCRSSRGCRRSSSAVKEAAMAHLACTTTRFYEDFLGLPLAAAIRLTRPRRACRSRAAQLLPARRRLVPGFFDVPGTPGAFTPQHDFDLHIALEVEVDTLASMMDRARREGIEVRGVADHGFIDSIYLRDPDGYVVELCARRGDAAAAMDSAEARRVLARWQDERRAITAAGNRVPEPWAPTAQR
jgi:catechol 2,3-dioxygenase-like lactoylglutathione lyase family enzyme